MPLVILIVLGATIISFGKYAWGYKGNRDEWLLKAVSATATAFASAPPVVVQQVVVPADQAAAEVVPLSDDQGFAEVGAASAADPVSANVISETEIMSAGISIYHEGTIVDAPLLSTVTPTPGDLVGAREMAEVVQPVQAGTIITLLVPAGVRVDVVVP